MILDKIMVPKRFFDVNSKVDVETYSQFLRNASWGGNPCPFLLEEPYLTIPDMIKDKLVHKFLKVERRV